MSHLEKVKKIVTGLKAGDPGAFAHYVSDELEIDSPVLAEIPQQANPSKMFVSVLQYWLSAFPTVASRWVSVDESEDQVVVHWEASAIHSGTDFLGVPARGREFEYSGTTTYTFAGGQLVAYSAQVDTDAILAQISEE